MAIKEDVCDNCKEKVYSVNGRSWYHVASRRWHCGDSVVDSLDVRGAVPASSTGMAREGSNA